MYTTLLALHSLVRWLVLLSLVYAIYRAYRGWLDKQDYNQVDDFARKVATSIVHVQLILGLWLYFISPIVDFFLHNFKVAVHERAIRFFGMEHSFMMILGIIVITIGSARTKCKTTSHDKFKAQALWFTLGLLIILSSIPWAFSPLVSRPWFRAF